MTTDYFYDEAHDLYIVGDEAYTAAEMEAIERKRARDRERNRRWYEVDPNRQKEKNRRYRERHPDKVREFRVKQNEQRRAKRLAETVEVVGSLHHLRCTGAIQATGCVCNRNGIRKIRVIRP